MRSLFNLLSTTGTHLRVRGASVDIYKVGQQT